MSKLCVSITETTAPAVIAAMKTLPAGVDMAEVRLDCLDGDYTAIKSDLQKICENRDRPIIVTNRPVWEGGGWSAGETWRLLLLKEAADMGADYVDVELRSLSNISLSELPTRKIISYHNYEETPSDLEIIYRQCRYSGADIVKIATTAADISDSARMLGFLKKHSGAPPHLIALCMGEEGIATRVLAPKFGGYLSFASQGAGKNSAPGQIEWRDMIGMYRFKQINAATGIYGVMADPVSHSMSPAIHNAAFASRDINAVYLPLKVKDPAQFLDSFQPLGVEGLSVTIPHKTAVIPLMDELDDLAARVGALNTVNISDGRRFGYNTDVAAALGVLGEAVKKRRNGDLSRCSILLIGAGGTARALACGLSGSIRSLVIANRTVSRAEELAAGTGALACSLEEMENHRPDIIINTTSVGMHPETGKTPVAARMLAEKPIVADAVYNPIETRLLREAKEAGCITASGFDWFVDQAAEQFRIWTGRQAPRELMAEVVRRRLG